MRVSRCDGDVFLVFYSIGYNILPWQILVKMLMMTTWDLEFLDLPLMDRSECVREFLIYWPSGIESATNVLCLEGRNGFHAICYNHFSCTRSHTNPLWMQIDRILIQFLPLLSRNTRNLWKFHVYCSRIPVVWFYFKNNQRTKEFSWVMKSVHLKW